MKPTPHLLLMPPNWIGDVIMAQPAMRAICEHYIQHCGTTQISICGRPWLNDLLPYLNLDAPGQHCRYRSEIPQADTAFLFPNSFRSALACKRAGVKRVIGYRGQWRSLLLSQALPQRVNQKNAHHRNFHLDIARQLNISIPHTEVSLCMPEHGKAAGQQRMRQHKLDPQRVICIAPGAQFGGAKCYPAAAYHSVVRQLAEAGWQILILGMPEDHDIGQRILNGLSTAHWNAAGKTNLTEALQLIGGCRLMLCNDSGLMHVAAGLGIATVTPFGATDPARTSPSGPHVRIIYEPAACSPCLQRECSVEGHPCMTNISPAQLFEACQSLLEPTDSGTATQ